MKTLFPLGFFLVVFCASYSVFAQSSLLEQKSGNTIITLQEVLEKIHNQGLQIAIAKQRYIQDIQVVNDAWANWSPSISLSGSYRLTSGEIDNAGSISGAFSAKQGSWTFYTSISQTLFSWYGLTQVGSAYHIAEAARHRMVGSVQDTFLQTIQTYLDVLIAQASQKVAEGRMRTARIFTESMRKSVEVGQISQVEMLSAEARLLQIISAFRLAQSQTITTVAQYRTLLGEEPGVLVWPSLPSLPDAKVFLTRSLFSPEVKASQRLEKAITWQESGLGGLFIPSITANLSYTNSPFNSTLFDTQRQQALRLELQANLSINPLTAYSEFRKTISAKHQRRTEFHLAARMARNTIIAHLALLERFKSLLSANQKEEQVRQATYESMKTSFSLGSLSLYDFYAEEDKLWESRLQTLQARRDTLMTSYILLRSTGDLTIANLFDSHSLDE